MTHGQTHDSTHHAAPDFYDAMQQGFHWSVPTHFNMAEVCSRRWAAQADAGQRIAIITHQANGMPHTHSYAELQQAADALSHVLAGLGVQRGDRILLISQNCPQWVVAFYAALRAEAAIVPINPMSTAGEIDGYQQDSGATVAFVAQEFLGNVMPCLGEGGQGLQAVVVHAYSDALPATDPDTELPEVVTEPRQQLDHA